MRAVRFCYPKKKIYIYIYPYMHTHLHIHIDLFRFAIKGVITIFVVAVDVFHG